MDVDETPAVPTPPSDIMRQDLLSQNLGVIRAVISDNHYEFPGSQNCRKMLVDLAPLALKAPINERHPVQEMVVEMLGEALNSAQQALEEQNSWRYVKVRECEEEVVKTQDSVADIEKQILNQGEQVAKLEVATEDASGAIHKTQSEIEDRTKSLAKVEAQSSSWNDMRQQCVAIMDGSYRVLKE